MVKTKHVIIKFVPFVVGVLFMAFIFLITTEIAEQSAQSVLDETLTFAQDTCERYDIYESGNKARDMVGLQEKATVIARYEKNDKRLDASVLQEYMDDTKLTGVYVLDENLDVVAKSGSQDQTMLLEQMKNPSVTEILTHPYKSYMERVEIGEHIYDLAVVTRYKQDGLVLCYHDITGKKISEGEITIQSLLSGYRFKMDGTILITDGVQIVNSNEQNLDGINLSDTFAQKISDETFQKIKYNGEVMYGATRTYKTYQLYAAVTKKQVFSIRTMVMIFSGAIYVLSVFIFMFFRNLSAQANFKEHQKQNRTIQAIGSMYKINILCYLKSDTWEAFKMPKELQPILEGKVSARKMIACYINQVVAESYQKDYQAFLNFATMPDRLQNKSFLNFVSEEWDGKWSSTIVAPQQWGEDGTLEAVVLAVCDVTEERKQKIAYAARLNQVSRQAERDNSEKLDYLRRMSHDLRSCVYEIRRMVEISRKNSHDPAKQEQCRETILTTSGYALDLVGGIVDMNKLESDTIVLEDKVFDIRKLYDTCSDIFREKAKQADILFEKAEFSGEHTRVIGSPMHLRQALENIMSNAIVYNKKGGKISTCCVETSSENGAVTFEFVCKDNGIGMTEEFQQIVFEPFAKEEQSGEYKGTGLGLSIAKGFIEKMGGSISFTSEKNFGTMFTVTITLRMAEKPEEEDYTDIWKSAIAGKTILVVEDNDLNMDVACLMLEEADAVVKRAYNGKEAVEIISESRKQEIDAILMDMMMPVMDGMTATKMIRNLDRPDSGSIPIIAMLTNAFSQDDIKRSLEVGMNDYLVKPLHQKTLAQTIAKNIAK